MKPNRARSLLVTAVVLALGGLGWFFLAPTQIGGSTRYMITHGISMEPMLHTGDLVLVRPADDYKVGQVVAYHSTLLHTVVLHRIIAIADGHYTFKGDNNNFIDPTHPTRALLVGRMWLHIPHGGTVLDWVHEPWVAAALTGGVAMLLMFGGDKQRRRRRRGRRHDPASRPSRGLATVTNRKLHDRRLLAACSVGVALFAVLSVVAFARSAVGTTTVASRYTQQLTFGYHGPARTGSVYPNGTVSSGEPIYLQLVHQLTLTAAYKLITAAPNRVHGTIRIRGTLANDTGWRRSYWLGPTTRFSGDSARTSARLDLAQLQALTNRVSTQIGLAADGSYTLAVVPEVRLAGEIAGNKLTATISPALDLALGAGQLATGGSNQPSTSSSGSTAGSAQSGLVRTTPGSVGTSRSAARTLLGVPVNTVRWVALVGLALFAVLALLCGLRQRTRTPDPIERINHRYKHLIVPVSSITASAEHPPIDVRSIEALAQLAERSERLILHDHQEDVDNYLIDDQGTIFRFQALRRCDTNGNRNGNGSGTHDEPPVTAGVAAATADEADALGKADAAEVTVHAEASDSGGESVEHDSDDHEQQSGDAAVLPEQQAQPGNGHLDGIPPPSDAKSSAQAIHLGSKVTSTVFGPEPRRPPIPNYRRWSTRPEVRVVFTLAPLLTFMAWWQARSRRMTKLAAEVEDQRSSQTERRRSAGQDSRRGSKRSRQRSPGDRRRGERRHNF